MPRYGSRGAAPVLRTAPVLAVLVCHDGEEWLPEALAALRRSAPRPRHVLAVDTGSTDDTPGLLSDAARGEDRVLDGVLTLERDTGFAAAVQEAVSAAIERWGDPGGWIWVLHDDCAPGPECLATLLSAADASPSAGVLGPFALDWDDSRLVVEAGLSTDASGHRQTGLGPSEVDWSRLGRDYEQSTEVLAVPSAGMLVRRELWEKLGGFDPAITLLREDIDFGWRANRSGSVVLSVPAARMRHARAVVTRQRQVDAPRASTASVERAQGMRTFLVNCALLSFVVGVPRLVLLSLVRAFGFGMQRRLVEARAELSAVAYLMSGRAGLLEGRTLRRASVEVRGVRGLFTSRLTRLRNGVRAAVAHIVRRRLQADAALGRLPDALVVPSSGLVAELAGEVRLPVGPTALPAGAHGRPRRPAGLRQPATSVAVALAVPDAVPPQGLRPSPHRRPSPVPRDGSAPSSPAELMVVAVDRARLARQVFLAPPVLLFLGLLAVALYVNAGRLGFDLTGGRLLPVPDLVTVWSSYLETWHPVAGGTAAPAPAALAIVGGLGAVLGGPQAAVAVLLLGSMPLSGLLAYVATRRLPVHRWVRALVAAAYALLPPATAAVAQGRLDTVVAHLLVPPVTTGIIALLGRSRTTSAAWLSTAASSAFGLAVIGAFSPLVHLLLVAYALAGFVVLPGYRGTGGRRVAALFVVVLMPLALLLPWPAVLIQHPGVVLHGVGAYVPTPAASLFDLVSLDPGGPGAWPVVGLVVVGFALVAIAVRPRRTAFPGLALAVTGGCAVALVRLMGATPITGALPMYGWAGPGLVLGGWGLLHALLGVCRTGGPAISWVRPAAALGVLGVLGLALGALVAGRTGPLTNDVPHLATTLSRELADSGRWVLILPSPQLAKRASGVSAERSGGQPGEGSGGESGEGSGGESAEPRMTAGRLPTFGDDDLAPVNDAVSMRALADVLRSDPKAGVAQAASAGVLFVVVPTRAEAASLRASAGDLVADAPPTSDGRPVLRLQPAAGAVTLLSPEQARRAVTGGEPSVELGTGGIVPVEASPPSVAVRVSDGPSGRLLVIAAEEEPGWTATIDGQQVPIVRAWNHLVAVSLPTRAANVQVDQPTALRSVLLLTQAAMVLFIALTAIPTRRPHPRESRIHP
ncbi:glycosyltransferase [Actinophytocola sp.]|uniref:glycosyltransferase n=1 Tax=Actinophytocola sp. TaxID=1872138 RepID=UPI002D2B7E61|nr:glycosyltransferase [Actinophytocola sp.]HYQ65517.1 glycosyltransferase [Actinophytocola sp.]